MLSSSLSHRVALLPVATAVVVFALSLTIAATTGRAEDSKTPAKDAKEPAKTEADPAKVDAEPDFTIPDGTSTEILEFLDKLKKHRPKFANQHEQIDYAIKMQRAFIDAGDKILKQDVEEKVAVNAVQMKMGALTLLATNNIGETPKEAMVAAVKHRADERAAVAKAVEPFWGPIRIANVGTMSAPDRKKLAEELIATVSESKFSRESIRDASQLGDVLSNSGNVEEAGQLYDSLAKLAKESDDPKFQTNAERFEGIARRLRLPGNFMNLEGKMLGGEDFDWASYRGKVVLVDFWATWCGPCIGELPNVKENYRKYHDKGFDVVGISLDRSRAPLDKFIETQELPWAQLYEEAIQANKGWNHPMAQHYGINAIPAAILVDKEGKVVTLKARGDELSKQLEKLLGKAE